MLTLVSFLLCLMLMTIGIAFVLLSLVLMAIGLFIAGMQIDAILDDVIAGINESYYRHPFFA